MNENTLTLFAAFRVSSSHPISFDPHDVPGTVQELEDVLTLVADQDVTVHGWYDVSGTRADTDILLVLRGASADNLQWSLRQLRRTQLLKPLIRVWGTMCIGDAGLTPDATAATQPWIAVCRSSGPLDQPCVIEGSDFAHLAHALHNHHTMNARHAAHTAESFSIGRFIETVELVEVLQ